MKPWYPHQPYIVPKSDVVLAALAIPTTGFVLSQYALLVQQYLRVPYSGWFELGMVVGQLVFQCLFIYKQKSRWFPYVVYLLQVSLIGSILLVPLLLVNSFFSLHPIQNVVYFFIVVIIMFFIHNARVKLLRLPWYICYTWVLYRFLILLFILKF